MQSLRLNEIDSLRSILLKSPQRTIHNSLNSLKLENVVGNWLRNCSNRGHRPLRWMNSWVKYWWYFIDFINSCFWNTRQIIMYGLTEITKKVWFNQYHPLPWMDSKTIYIYYIKHIMVNSLRPSDAYMASVKLPPLIQIMACRLVGAKPLSEPVLEYC